MVNTTIHVGSSILSGGYVGGDALNKIYLGSTLLYELIPSDTIEAGIYKFRGTVPPGDSSAEFDFVTNGVTCTAMTASTTGISYMFPSPMGNTQVYTDATRSWTLDAYKVITLPNDTEMPKMFSIWFKNAVLRVYPITNNLTNVVASSSNDAFALASGTTILQYTAADGYSLPETITVTGAESYAWDSNTGTLTLNGATGPVSVTIVAEQATQIMQSGTYVWIDNPYNNMTSLTENLTSSLQFKGYGTAFSEILFLPADEKIIYSNGTEEGSITVFSAGYWSSTGYQTIVLESDQTVSALFYYTAIATGALVRQSTISAGTYKFNETITPVAGVSAMFSFRNVLGQLYSGMVCLATNSGTTVLNYYDPSAINPEKPEQKYDDGWMNQNDRTISVSSATTLNSEFVNWFNTNANVAYAITTTLTNVTASVDNESAIAVDETVSMTFTASANYNLPQSVTVTGATYSWNQETGVLTLSAPTESVIVVITGEASGKIIKAGTYLFNASLTSSDIILQQIRFDSQGAIYYQMRVSNNGYKLEWYDSGDSWNTIYADGTWENKNNKTIIIGNDQSVSTEFYEWFNANATIPFTIPAGTYTFNDEVTAPVTELDEYFTFYITRFGAQEPCNRMTVYKLGSPIEYNIVLDDKTEVYDAGGWMDDEFKVIIIKSDQSVSSNFYTWFKSNTTAS